MASAGTVEAVPFLTTMIASMILLVPWNHVTLKQS